MDREEALPEQAKEVTSMKATLKSRLVKLAVAVAPVAILAATFAGGKVP